MSPLEPSPSGLRRDPLPLRGRAALVTGVSRRAGIGYAIARRLAAGGPGKGGRVFREGFCCCEGFTTL